MNTSLNMAFALRDMEDEAKIANKSFCVTVATPTKNGSSLEASEKEYHSFDTEDEAKGFVEQFNKDNRFNASRAYYEGVENA